MCKVSLKTSTKKNNGLAKNKAVHNKVLGKALSEVEVEVVDEDSVDDKF